MGLIIVPVMVFWLAALFFTCRAGFYWMVDESLFPDGVLLVLAAVTATEAGVIVTAPVASLNSLLAPHQRITCVTAHGEVLLLGR